MTFLRFVAPWLGLLLLGGCVSARREYVITDFGAVAGGAELATRGIQAAIDTAARAGGGTVVVPAGVFRSGSIFLRPGVQLHLAAGAVLKGSENIADYPKRPTRIEGHIEPWRMALVNAEDLAGVRITGPGRLDGSGPVYWRAFWQRRKENPKCTNLEVERPRLIYLARCRDVRIEEMALQDSGFWNLHLYACRDVVLTNLRITIPSATGGLRGPSTDGIDIDSSQRVTVTGCYISTHDDDIALKGSKGPHADRDTASPPVEDILVENCEIGDGNGLVTCGSEATVVRRVMVRNCTLTGRATMLTLKLRPDTPQRYSDITLDGIKLAGEGRLLNVAPWMQFFDLQGQPPPARTVERIVLRNITGRYRAFGTLRGNAGDTLRDITLENVDVQLTDEAFAPGPVANLALRNVRVNGREVSVPRR